MTTGNRHYGHNQLYWVADNILSNDFPDPDSALRDPDGLLAIGGDLSAERLLTAYQNGIFPWFNAGQPILWWSPDPRCVLLPEKIRISSSLRKTLRKNKFRITFNRAFKQVIEACAEPRGTIKDTWITTDMMNAYLDLHHSGYANSVECWLDDRLAGGLYGVVIGRIFFGESMFSRESDSSKVALVHLAHHLNTRKFRLIDCQVYSNHLQRLGAEPMPRSMFLNVLRHYCHTETISSWPEESIYP